MKKSLKIILITILVLCLSLCLAACGETGGGDDGSGEGNGTETETPTFLSAEQIEANFTGGSITMKLTTDGTVCYFTVIECDAGCFYSSYVEPKAVLDGSLAVRTATGYDFYEVADGQRTFIASFDSDTASESYINDLFTDYFTSYTSLSEDSFEKAGSATIAGRACTKYEYTFISYAGSVQYQYFIDDATGICMKYTGSFVAGGQSGSYCWEITQLTLGSTSLSPYDTLPIAQAE